MTKTITPHAAAAKAIRKELKAKYPNEKMSVTSESFSMGNAVRVAIGKSLKYIDGFGVDKNTEEYKMRQEVEAITNKYQYGKFDGMQDMYEMTNCRDDIPQVKYVTVTSYDD